MTAPERAVNVPIWNIRIKCCTSGVWVISLEKHFFRTSCWRQRSGEKN